MLVFVQLVWPKSMTIEFCNCLLPSMRAHAKFLHGQTNGIGSLESTKIPTSANKFCCRLAKCLSENFGIGFSDYLNV